MSIWYNIWVKKWGTMQRILKTNEKRVWDEYNERIEFLSRVTSQTKGNGTFISQTKYAKELIKKSDLADSKPAITPMSSTLKLNRDLESPSVDVKKHRGMIGSRTST